MRCALPLMASWLLSVGSPVAAAAGSCDSDWSTDRRSNNPGIVLEAGIAGFKVGQPPPPELLEKIGPLLCAAGSEELRVTAVDHGPPRADPARQPQLSAGQTKDKAAAGLQQTLNEQLGTTGRKFAFVDASTKLIYEIERSGFAPARGVLAWSLSAIDVESRAWYQVHVDAATGRIMRAWVFAK